MAKVKYDLSSVEDMPDSEHAPVGVYRAKIESAESGRSKSSDNPMITVRMRITHSADGKKVKEDFMPVWYYPILEHDSPFVMKRTSEFFGALGLKLKGTLDTDKIVGESVQVKLKSDTDEDGDYRPKISKVMALAEDEGEEEAEDEEAEDEDDDASEAEDDDEEEVDLDELDRKELKALIKENELDISIKKSMSDDDIRAAITEALSDDEEEEEDEDDDEEEEDDDESPDYDSMAVSDLKAALKERELPTNGSKKVLVARLQKDDGDEPF